MQQKSAPLIAIIGCDGSGKSTVCENVESWITQYGPAQRVHLGKQSGNVGRAIAKWPLIGSVMDRWINKKTQTARTRIKSNKMPGLLPSLVIVAFTLRRKRRFKRMLALRQQGYIIVTDRYPQISHVRAYDGPSFPETTDGSKLILRMAQWERSVFEWMASYQPDLVLRLNVDLDTACARKPDHRREALAKKISVTPLLNYNGAPIVDIDTVQPLSKVLEDVHTAIAKIMAGAGYASATQQEPHLKATRVEQ